MIEYVYCASPACSFYYEQIFFYLNDFTQTIGKSKHSA